MPDQGGTKALGFLACLPVCYNGKASVVMCGSIPRPTEHADANYNFLEPPIPNFVLMMLRMCSTLLKHYSLIMIFSSTIKLGVDV